MSHVYSLMQSHTRSHLAYDRITTTTTTTKTTRHPPDFAVANMGITIKPDSCSTHQDIKGGNKENGVNKERDELTTFAFQVRFKRHALARNIYFHKEQLLHVTA